MVSQQPAPLNTAELLAEARDARRLACVVKDRAAVTNLLRYAAALEAGLFIAEGDDAA